MSILYIAWSSKRKGKIRDTRIRCFEKGEKIHGFVCFCVSDEQEKESHLLFPPDHTKSGDCGGGKNKIKNS